MIAFKRSKPTNPWKVYAQFFCENLLFYTYFVMHTLKSFHKLKFNWRSVSCWPAILTSNSFGSFVFSCYYLIMEYFYSGKVRAMYSVSVANEFQSTQQFSNFVFFPYFIFEDRQHNIVCPFISAHRLNDTTGWPMCSFTFCHKLFFLRRSGLFRLVWIRIRITERKQRDTNEEQGKKTF